MNFNEYQKLALRTANKDKDLVINAAVTRIVDKTNRLLTLCTRKQKVDESIRDTLLDLANYSIMTVIELDKGD